MVVMAMLLLVASPAVGQSKWDRFKDRVLEADSMVGEYRKKVPFDTNYVKRPPNRVTLKVRANLSGDAIHTRGTVNDVNARTDLHTRRKFTLSFGANYQGLSGAVALNPAKLAGKYSDYEVNLNYYSSHVCFDGSYHKSNTLSGRTVIGGHESEMGEGYVNMKVLNLAGFYVFNHRRFSYSAAHTQSAIQVRSAGTWLAGLSYRGGHLLTTDKIPDIMPNFKVRAHHLGVGGGYAYNLVAWKKWLFHVTVMPTIAVLNLNSMTVNEEKVRRQNFRLNMLFNERVSIVYNFSPRYFLCFNAIIQNTLFDDKVLVVNQNKWRARASIGVRLW